jgi:hypothetical protein
MELYNLWHGLSRCLFLSSAFRARDGVGARISLTTATCQSVDEALTHAIRRTKPYVFKKKPQRKGWKWVDEPVWSKPSVLLDSLDEIGASNFPTVLGALSTLSPVFDHLPRFRHFFAHRNEDTVDALQRILAWYSIPTSTRPTEALLTPASGSSGARFQPLLLDWIDDVRNSVSLIV